MHRHRPRQNFNIPNCPSSHRRLLPTPNSIEHQEPPSLPPPPDLQPASFTALPAIPNPTRRGETLSKVFSLLSDAISQRLSFVRVFRSSPDFVFGDLPNSAWKPFSLEGELSSTSESSPERRYLSLKTAVMVTVLVALALVVAFVLRCRVCGVDGWRGPKNPFRPRINHPLEGESLCFGGEPVALEEGVPPSDVVGTAEVPVTTSCSRSSSCSTTGC